MKAKMTDKVLTLKILFFPDMVGRPGRFAVRDFLQNPKSFNLETDIDFSECFVIANVENASHGFGLTEKNYNELSEYGVDCMTSGNHIWDKKEIFNYIENSSKLLRPINYPSNTCGKGSGIFEFKGYKIGVINALGRVFMAPIENPWTVVKDEIERIKQITPIIIIDFHAEATAEKLCFAKYCSELGCSAFFGTHTHIQTADECILNNKTGYITDAGFCGAAEGIIGMDYNTSLSRFLTCIPERYDVANSKTSQVNAVLVEINPETGVAVDIKRFFCSRNEIEEVKSQ
jgi:metallophosphoesterase (TIGR00282 family)